MSQMLLNYYEIEQKKIFKSKSKSTRSRHNQENSKVKIVVGKTPKNTDNDTPDHLDDAFCELETSDEL